MRGILSMMADWWRGQDDDTRARAWLAERRRAFAAELLARAAELRRQRDTLLTQSQAAEHYADRCRLYCHAIAMDLRAEAQHALAGGDHAEAARMAVEAADYDQRAEQWGAPRPAVCVPEKETAL